MRPRALTVSAFGPFPMQEHVDFTHLDAHGLFLISGPTGSGKTSLLDAMCFALYGRVPGARGELTNDHLRSDHAAPATPTRVVFEFEAGGARWRVTRTPEQDRPKQRGSGTTRRPATAELERWAGEQWEPVAAKTGAVTERITRLVGLSADQFRTVVLLPQGRFQEALHASTTERQELLRTLFGTELYRRVTDVLWRRAKDAHGLVAAGRDELARHREAAGTHLGELRRLAPDAALGDPGDLPEPVDDGALLASADQVIEVVEAAARAGRSAAGQAQEALTEARALAARFDEHAVLQAERARLDAADAQVETWRERLVAAERAASAVEVVRSAVAATERASDARDALAAATDGWSGATAAARALGAPVLVAVLGDESMPTPDALVEAVLRAEQAASEVEALSTARRELADAEAALAHAEARCATATSLAGEHR